MLYYIMLYYYVKLYDSQPDSIVGLAAARSSTSRTLGSPCPMRRTEL